MRLNSEFDSLDTYMSVYGVHSCSGSMLRIYLKEGLGVSSELRSIFHRRYFYDPWARRKYREVKMIDGLLVAQLESSDEWIQYNDKTISEEILKYEYVGGCWFVFEGVFCSFRKIEKYLSDHDKKEEGKIVEELVFSKATYEGLTKYLLEGVLDVPPGPGWVSWEVYAKSFYVEIPE
jgi:hypothetical protein